ncbi:hypothetical protein BJY01DRAFT_255493 [Aspergillus pseudoustus]|uniref:Ankyrin repeat-containing domain protein n=1 Tax=Aspergillus pseudoustus TaxID=1810923 RepID=A0ABR4IJZ2_9EURO
MLVAAGEDINEPAPLMLEGTAIQAAAIAGHAEMAAAAGGNIAIVKRLLQQGADVTAPVAEYDGCTPLQHKAPNKRLQRLKEALDHRHATNVMLSALSGLCSGLHPDERVWKLVLETMAAYAGPLRRAFMQRAWRRIVALGGASMPVDALALLLESGAGMNDLHPVMQITCLQTAIYHGTSQRPDSFSAAHHEGTPLQEAIKQPWEDVIDMLLVRGVDVNAPPAHHKGGTAL